MLFWNRRVRAAVVAALVTGVAVFVGLPTLARQTPQELIREGNRLWEEKSYGLAEEAYTKALAAAPNLPEKAEIEYRLAVSLGRSEQWDRAAAAIDAYVKTYRDTSWEARGQVWRGRLYNIIVHNAYKVGEKIFRGSNVPKSDGKTAPEAINLTSEDAQKVAESFTQAELLFERFRKMRVTEDERARLTRDEIDLDFDLANIHNDDNDLRRFDPKKVDWTIDLTQPFDRRWPSAKKVMYLYEKIIALDSSLPNTDHHATVLATFGKATYILRLRQYGPYIYPQPIYRRGGRRPVYDYEGGFGGRGGRILPIPLEIPYREIDPIRLLDDVLAKYPQDSEADRLLYTIAVWTEQKGDALAAVTRYADFLRRYPNSRWASDAQGQLDNIHKPSLSLSVTNVTRPGKRATVGLSTRNISQVRFVAYRIYPEEIYGKVEGKAEDKTNDRIRPAFNDFYAHFIDNSRYDTRPQFRKEKVAEWAVTTSDTGKHQAVYDAVTTPVDAMGAYLIEARAGETNELGASTVAFVSDISVVQKVDTSSVLTFATDAETGRPLQGVKFLFWSPVYVHSSPREREAKYFTGETNADGVCRQSLPALMDDGDEYGNIYRPVQAMAMAGNNRYALVYTENSNLEKHDGERAFRAFVYTDRPLYRPKQDVRFRVVITEGTTGRYKPTVGKDAEFVVYKPGGGELVRKKFSTGEFGNYGDSVTLPAGASLGDYSIQVLSSPDKRVRLTYGAATFRIEEYKKPEFSVGVQPEKSQVRVGEQMRVKVAAKYFFGSPVANAKVHYKVFRTPYAYPIPFRPRLAWFEDEGRYGSESIDRSYWGDTNTAYREGDVQTDAKGEAIVTFPTDPPKPPKGYRINPNYYPDQNFTVIAEVVDDSRRQVTGVGAARAAATQFHAFLKLDRRFALAGEAVKIEARATDINGKPVSTGGYIRIKKLIPAIPEQKAIDPKTGKEVVVVKYVPPREEDNGMLFVPTDAEKEGSGLAFWHPDTPGDFRLDYEAKDAWGNTLYASTSILIYGPGFDARLNKDDQRFQLTPEFENYRPGDNMRLLIVTPKPDSYVMLTENSVGFIQKHRTVYVPGRSVVIPVQVSAALIPNAALEATTVREGHAYQANAEIGVPSEDSILSLKVTANKADYRPGEKASFTILATDASGKPARGQFSLGVVDESLLAMQPDLTPDIRRWYYGNRYYTYFGQGDSGQFQPGQHVFAPLEAGYERHNLIYPEGMGWLYDYAYNGGLPGIPNYVAYTPIPRQLNQQAQYRYGYGFGKDGGGFGGGRFRGAMGPAGPTNGAVYDADVPVLGDMPLIGSLHFGDMLKEKADKRSESKDGGETGKPGSPQNLVEATVRKAFADTAFWIPSVVTDADGTATVSFDFPDNLTGWKATSRGMTTDVKVGVGDTQTLTKKNLMVRLQAPRFFVDTDKVTISANVHNYLATQKPVRVEIVTESDRIALSDTTVPGKIAANGEAPGMNVVRGDESPVYDYETRLRGFSGQPTQVGFVNVDRGFIPASCKNACLSPFPVSAANESGKGVGGLGDNASVRQITLTKDGEMRIDWVVDIKKAGLTKIKVVAQTDEESDAAELEFPVYVHGVEKFLAQSGVMKDGGYATITYDIPELRKKGATLLNVQLSPSLASVMLDALPYLEDYPYGCVEQTLSRFVPTVLVAKTLSDSGIDLETLGKRLTALEEQRKNIPPQQVYENSGYTYPKGIPGVLDAKELASRIVYSNRRGSAPVFNSGTLKAMVEEGLQRLYKMQREDGGWGWWEGSAVSDPYLTAYVLEGLTRAAQADIPVTQDVLQRGRNYLRTRRDANEDLPLRAYFEYVLAVEYVGKKVEQDDATRKSLAFLYERRDRMNTYGQALLAMAMNLYSDKEKAQVLLRNLVNTAKIDKERGTVHWEGDTRFYWRWYNDKQETTAMVLRALVAIGGQEQLAVQNGSQAAQTGLAPMTVRWLVDNRRGGFWTSTRQTANVVNALMEYAKAQKELTPDYTVMLDLDGKVQKSFHITKENALLFDSRFLVGDEVFTSGAQSLRITMQGSGTLYYSSYLKYFDMQEPIKGVANAIGVERKYYKLAETKKTDKKGETKTTTERVPLQDGASLVSGDIIEVELFLKSDNDYEYLVFEDMKPAGCEALETRSGVAYGDGLCSNMELRDEKVAFFIDLLPQGTRRLTYKLRAEIPGRFHALPTNAYAMYTPDIRALSDEWRVTVTDAPPAKIATASTK